MLSASDIGWLGSGAAVLVLGVWIILFGTLLGWLMIWIGGTEPEAPDAPRIRRTTTAPPVSKAA